MIVKLFAESRLDMSSSSPPHPQNWLEYPFTFLIISGVREDTPPNSQSYGSLYLSCSTNKKSVWFASTNKKSVLFVSTNQKSALS